jgi:hypothetical protein
MSEKTAEVTQEKPVPLSFCRGYAKPANFVPHNERTVILQEPAFNGEINALTAKYKKGKWYDALTDEELIMEGNEIWVEVSNYWDERPMAAD